LSPKQLAYAVAAALPLDLLWKQQILELRSEAERQERLLAYLRGLGAASTESRGFAASAPAAMGTD